MNPPVFGDVEQQETQDFISALAGMGMEKSITVFNPLPVDFRVKYTRSVPINAGVSPELQYAREKTGLDLSRRGQTSGHVAHTVVLKAQISMVLPGDIAQIAVQKLINTIIQTRNDDGTYDFDGHGGNKGMVPDPHRRREVEGEIVRQIRDTMSMMNRETPTEFTERQIEEMNTEATDVPAPGTGSTYTPEEPIHSSPERPDSEESQVTQGTEKPVARKRGRPKTPVA